MTADLPHVRRNLLTGEDILVSPHRIGRPWRGDLAAPAPPPGPAHDPDCHLCPGNARASGRLNPAYDRPWAFDNDYPALLERSQPLRSDALLQSAPVTGQCRVVCYHPDHSRTMARMTTDEIAAVINLWAHEYALLAARPDIASVMIFENRGAMMGASSPHPHGQIWATSVVPVEAQREDDHQLAWRAAHGRPLLLDYLTHELALGERVVLQNDSFAVLTPFWAAWPFETLLVPRRPVGAIGDLTPGERLDLADVLKRLTIRYDNLFQTSFPYTFGWHQALTDGRDQSHAVLHAHFYPPLLRSATIRKHMVGFEMLAMAQRDLTPEEAAARLRALPDAHYCDA